LAGILAVLIVFSLLLGRALWIAIRTEDMFSRLLIIGCVVMLATALMINLGAAMGMLPTKGMPMPFVSYGGSALFGECILLGLVLSVQRHLPGNKRHEKSTASPRKRSSNNTNRKTATAKSPTPKAPVQAMDKGMEHLF